MAKTDESVRLTKAGVQWGEIKGYVGVNSEVNSDGPVNSQTASRGHP